MSEMARGRVRSVKEVAWLEVRLEVRLEVAIVLAGLSGSFSLPPEPFSQRCHVSSTFWGSWPVLVTWSLCV